MEKNNPFSYVDSCQPASSRFIFFQMFFLEVLRRILTKVKLFGFVAFACFIFFFKCYGWKGFHFFSLKLLFKVIIDHLYRKQCHFLLCSENVMLASFLFTFNQFFMFTLLFFFCVLFLIELIDFQVGFFKPINK